MGRQRGVIRRTTIKALESRWLVSIRTYFQLLKHTANLPADDKMRHLRKAADSSELFIRGLATKRAHIGTQPTYYYSGIVYINPLAEIDLERSKREMRYLLPMSFARNLGDLLINPQLAPAYRELLKYRKDNEIIRYLSRHLLLAIPGSKNQRAFLDNLLKSKSIVLQTCSIRGLREKFLGYSLSDESRTHYSNIIHSIANDPTLGATLQSKDLRKRRLLSDMRTFLRINDGKWAIIKP